MPMSSAHSRAGVSRGEAALPGRLACGSASRAGVSRGEAALPGRLAYGSASRAGVSRGESALELEFRELGRVAYAHALALQERLRDERLEGRGRDAVLLLEHPDVVTFGRSAKRQNTLLSDDELRARGYDVFRINRGGDVTYHGPGQLVGYPILDLSKRGSDVHAYLRALEGALIETLADFGVSARRREGFTGVWLDARRKIASIGVGVRRWVTLHGFALNVCCDLRRFEPIVPCGLPGIELVNLCDVAGPLEIWDVIPRVRFQLREAFA